jgi:selenium metabolism protein YedF
MIPRITSSITRRHGMEKIVDTRGLACPQPVILAKKALEEAKEVLVIADNDEAVENIRRLANKMECAIAVAREEDGAFRIRLTRGGEAPPHEGTDIGIVCGTAKEERGAPLPLVIVLSSDRLGRGNDELGEVLMQSFVHTLLTLEPRPDTIILYNTGVRLAGRESALIEDLKQLEAAGVALFVCGTCVNYFQLKEQLGAGIISNMYDIAAAMTGAGKLVIP